MGLKQDVIQLKAQIRVWERERILQDTKIQELENDIKTALKQFEKQTLLINSFTEHIKKLRPATQENSTGSNPSGSTE